MMQRYGDILPNSRIPRPNVNALDELPYAYERWLEEHDSLVLELDDPDLKHYKQLYTSAQEELRLVATEQLTHTQLQSFIETHPFKKRRPHGAGPFISALINAAPVSTVVIPESIEGLTIGYELRDDVTLITPNLSSRSPYARGNTLSGRSDYKTAVDHARGGVHIINDVNSLCAPNAKNALIVVDGSHGWKANPVGRYAENCIMVNFGILGAIGTDSTHNLIINAGEIENYYSKENTLATLNNNIHHFHGERYNSHEIWKPDQYRIKKPQFYRGAIPIRPYVPPQEHHKIASLVEELRTIKNSFPDRLDEIDTQRLPIIHRELRESKELYEAIEC